MSLASYCPPSVKAPNAARFPPTRTMSVRVGHGDVSVNGWDRPGGAPAALSSGYVVTSVTRV